MELYKAIKKTKKTSLDYIDEIVDKTCNSSTPVQKKQKVSFAHRKQIYGTWNYKYHMAGNIGGKQIWQFGGLA